MPGDTSYHVEDVCVLAESVVIVGYGRSEAPEGQPSPQIKTFSLNNVVDSVNCVNCFDSTIPINFFTRRHLVGFV